MSNYRISAGRGHLCRCRRPRHCPDGLRRYRARSLAKPGGNPVPPGLHQVALRLNFEHCGGRDAAVRTWWDGAAPRSSSVKLRGRWITHTWSAHPWRPRMLVRPPSGSVTASAKRGLLGIAAPAVGTGPPLALQAPERKGWRKGRREGQCMVKFLSRQVRLGESGKSSAAHRRRIASPGS